MEGLTRRRPGRWRTAATEGAWSGGVKGGQTLGETDELGVRAVGERYHMRDFHATILHLLGLDQNRVWYLNNGRQEKLTDFGGTPIERVWTGRSA